MTRFLPRRASLAAALCALAAFAACDEAGPPPTSSSPGTLVVRVNATGTNVDNQFSITVNGGEVLPYVSGASFERELPASVYTVRISDIAANCTLQGDDTVEAVVYAGRRVTTTFTVTCALA